MQDVPERMSGFTGLTLRDDSFALFCTEGRLNSALACALPSSPSSGPADSGNPKSEIPCCSCPSSYFSLKPRSTSSIIGNFSFTTA